MSSIITIPKKVKIGSMEYDISLENEVIVGEGQVYNGLIIFDDLVIRLWSNRSAQRLEETFIHEVLHGILRERDILIEDEEELVEMLGKGIYQFIIDNPNIFKGE